MLTKAEQGRQAKPLHQCNDQHPMGVDERIGRGDEATIRLARKRHYGRLDFRLVEHRRCRNVSAERCNRNSEFAYEDVVIRRGLRIEHDRHPPDVGDHLLDDVQPFADYGKVDIREAGDVPAGTSKARDEALSGRIVDSREDDRDGARGLFQRRNDRRGVGGDDVWRRVHQFTDVCLDVGNVAAGKTVLDLNVSVLRPSERLKSLSKRRYAGFYPGSISASPCKNAMRRIRSACCARAASGHETVAPPSSVMNSRRLTQ